MVEVTMAQDCGNAPKQVYVRDILAVCARGEREALAAAVSDEWTHRIAGHGQTAGSAATDDLIAALSPPGIHAMSFAVVISHGKIVTAQGAVLAGSDVTEFCCMITFSGHGKNATIADCVTFLARGAHDGL